MSAARRRGPAALVLVLALAAALGPAASGSADERVVGGRPAQPGEAPYQVALVRAGQQAVVGQFCGGTLVDPTHVVTAAHCVTGSDGTTTPTTTIDVLAGVTTLPGAQPAGQRRAVARIERMPDYDPATFDHDAAVLELADAVALDGDTRPLPLATERTTGGTVRISGWGDTTAHQSDVDGVQGTYPTALQVNDVAVVGDATCARRYGGGLDADAMLCAGGPGEDTCYGDSGGPAVQDGALVGITSFGSGCGSQSQIPGVYTEVADPAVSAFLREAAPAAVESRPPPPPTTTTTASVPVTSTPAPVATAPAPAPAPPVTTPAPVPPAPAPVAPAPTPATPAPRAAVVDTSASGRVSGTGRVAVRVRADTDARVSLRLLDGAGRRLATTSATLRAGVGRTLRLRLGPSARRRLRARALRVRLEVTGTASGVVGATRTVALRLRR